MVDLQRAAGDTSGYNTVRNFSPSAKEIGNLSLSHKIGTNLHRAIPVIV
jgi:hypothetical protein